MFYITRMNLSWPMPHLTYANALKAQQSSAQLMHVSSTASCDVPMLALTVCRFSWLTLPHVARLQLDCLGRSHPPVTIDNGAPSYLVRPFSFISASQIFLGFTNRNFSSIDYSLLSISSWQGESRSLYCTHFIYAVILFRSPIVKIGS
jgi:hypothetical protein